MALLPWIVRGVWALLPLLAGPAVADAFSDRSVAVARAGSIALWAGWGVVASASFVRHPLSLTLLRCAAPASVLVAVVALLERANGTSGAIAVVASALVTAVAFVPETALPYVNGTAYANESRFPLRAPGPLLAGPIIVAWALVVVVPYAAVLLIAARQWVAGAVAAAVGAASVLVLGRSLYSLARRWIVFVPAGVVLHDPMQLADPILFRRRDVRSLAPAPADTDATDLTARAFGLALELTTVEPAQIAFQKPGSRAPQLSTLSKLIFTPTRPGAVLAAARARRID